jgi:hypothetical protein
VPTTLVVTDAFENVARRLLKSLGYPDVPILITPNPVIYLTEPEIERRIDGLLEGLVASFDRAVERSPNV